MKSGNDFGRAGLRLSAECVSRCAWVDADATIRLSRSRLDGRRITAGSRPGDDPSNRVYVVRCVVRWGRHGPTFHVV
jgi:hypothetical protein